MSFSHSQSTSEVPQSLQNRLGRPIASPEETGTDDQEAFDHDRFCNAGIRPC